MSEVATVHGTVARVIDVPSQGMSYLRIEVPIEYHAELTRQFYGKRVLVVPAGAQMAGQPYGIFNVGAGQEGADDTPPPPAAPQARIKAPERDGPPGGPLSKSAAMIVNGVGFQTFAWHHETGSMAKPDDYGSGDADMFLKGFCEISSKAELDNSAAARALFTELMSDFRAWRELHPEHAE